MKLAVSNIAWDARDDENAYVLLQSKGVQGIEIAPTRVWPAVDKASRADAVEFRRTLSRYGLQIVAFQALLFGKPDLKVFDPATRRICLEYLMHQCDLAAGCGAHALVFGSPKNRLRGSMSEEDAIASSVEFFSELGAYAASQEVHICLEPNPEDYGCDFVRTVTEGAGVVTLTGSPGVNLHFDTGAMILNKEDAAALIQEHIGLAVHFHVSEPFLEDFSRPHPDHARAAAALGKSPYSGWISIEMRSGPRGLEAVEEAVDFVKGVYL